MSATLTYSFTIPEELLPLIIARGDPVDVSGAQAANGEASVVGNTASASGGQRVTATVSGGQRVQGEV